MNTLAIEGGLKTIREALPHFQNAAGRTFDETEEGLVLEALRSGCLSKNGGSMVRRLEREFAAMLDLPFATAFPAERLPCISVRPHWT